MSKYKKENDLFDKFMIYLSPLKAIFVNIQILSIKSIIKQYKQLFKIIQKTSYTIYAKYNLFVFLSIRILI